MKAQENVEILYEDKWLIVINKPAGLLSVGFPGHRGKTAQNILEKKYSKNSKIKISAVHRLDRDTSGVMMFATSIEAKNIIMNSWQEIVHQRMYRLVTCSELDARPLDDTGTIKAPIAYNRNDVGFIPSSKNADLLKNAETAVTNYKVLQRGSLYDLIECSLETGRKNQIRIHMAHLRHPIIGDSVYGLSHKKESPIHRLALHARILDFSHPFTSDSHRFEVPEPVIFSKIISKKKDMERSPKEAELTQYKQGNKQERSIGKESIPQFLTKAKKSGKTGSKFIPSRGK